MLDVQEMPAFALEGVAAMADGESMFRYALLEENRVTDSVMRTEDGSRWETYVFGPDGWRPSEKAVFPESEGSEYRWATESEAERAIAEIHARLERWLAQAQEIAGRSHAGQTDKGGHPYIGHPLRVSAACTETPAKVAALLHDVVEDTPVTLEDLRAAGFPDDIVSAIDLLTHRKGVPYERYVAHIAEDPIARMVKISDLSDNLDASRLGHEPTEKDEARLARYRHALQMLEGKDSER